METASYPGMYHLASNRLPIIAIVPGQTMVLSPGTMLLPGQTSTRWHHRHGEGTHPAEEAQHRPLPLLRHPLGHPTEQQDAALGP